MASEAAVGARPGAPGNRRLQRHGDGEAAPALAPCPLREPGILLRMIAPEPTAETSTAGLSSVGSASSSAVARMDGRAAALAAPGLGAALASYLLSLVVAERQWLPFGAHGGVGVAGCAAVFAGAAWMARRSGGTSRLLVAGGATALFAAAALLQLMGNQLLGGEPACSLLVLAAALGVVAGTATLAVRHVLVAAATAAAIVAIWQQVPRLSAAPLWMASIASGLWSLCLVGDSPRRAAVAAATWRWRFAFAGAFALGAVAACSAWEQATAAWWTIACLVGGSLSAIGGRLLPMALCSAALATLCVLTNRVDAHEPWRCRELARRGAAAAVYERSRQELQLHVGGVVVDAAGPDRHEAPLLATLAFAMTRPGDRVLVLGAGTGQTLALLRAPGQLALDVVDPRPDTAPLRARLSQDGPVPAPLTTSAWHDGERAAAIAPVLASAAAGSRQAVVVVEPLALANEIDTTGLLAAATAAAGDGYLLQAIALDRASTDDLQRVFAAAMATAPWNGLFVVGDAAVLASGPRAIDWAAVAPLAAWPADARWIAHRAHCGERADLQRALLGTLRWPSGDDDAAMATGSGRAASLRVLHDWLAPAADVPPSPHGSTLRRWQALQAELRQAHAALQGLGPDVGSRAEAQRLAARFLPIGAPTAWLQAALGTAGADGVVLLAPQLASRRAHAIDPTFFAAVPPFARELPVVTDDIGALEDLATLPAPARLAAAATGDDPRAVALRARFPSACARALVEALAAAPLADAGREALRALADPFVLAEAGAVLAPAGRLRELLGLWRVDLPVPAALHAMPTGSEDERMALAAALRGRREPSCRPLLAELLLDSALAVRRQASEALIAVCGELVPYDPAGPESQRAAAADRLRSLHNRAP